MPKENLRNPNAPALPQVRADARTFSYVLGFSALLLFTAVTIGARDDNTKALLLSKQRAAVSMTVPPEPKLAYNGPMYLGDDKWNADGQVLSSAAPAHVQGAKAGKEGAPRAAKTEHNQGIKEGSGSKASLDTRLSSAFLRKEAPGLARDVDTVGEIAHKTAHAFANIQSGMAQAFDMKDSTVHPKKPVKVLTHV